MWEKFQNYEINKFELNLSNGRLTYYEGSTDPKNAKTYYVPDVNVFYNDVEESLDERLVQKKNDNTIVFEYDYTVTQGAWLVSMLSTAILLIAVVVFWIIMMRRMNQSMSGGDKAMGFGKANIKNVSDDKRKDHLCRDVAGADEEKEELSEVVEFLKDPKQIQRLGRAHPQGRAARRPSGHRQNAAGPAPWQARRACRFFSISGSDFVEMFVGVGASRVRDLFEQAKKNCPGHRVHR